MSLMAASTRDAAPIGGWDGELQQLAERGGSGMMHGRTHHHLDGFQIDMARLAALLENDTQQLVYFPRDLLADRFGRFFSSALGASSSTGRNLQTCSLTSNSCP